MHPLGTILTKWAGLQVPEWMASSLLELREMEALKGKFVFLLNHGDKVAEVEFAEDLQHPPARVREIIEGKALPTTGKTLHLRAAVPAQAAKIFQSTTEPLQVLSPLIWLVRLPSSGVSTLSTCRIGAYVGRSSMRNAGVGRAFLQSPAFAGKIENRA